MSSLPFIRLRELAASCQGKVGPVNATDWLAAYAQKLGTEPPTKDELKAVLDLAGEAAHGSQRIAAPVACWLAARAGVDLDDAMRLAREVDGDG
jgi:Domain of unknown function (DUF6457)